MPKTEKVETLLAWGPEVDGRITGVTFDEFERLWMVTEKGSLYLATIDARPLLPPPVPLDRRLTDLYSDRDGHLYALDTERPAILQLMPDRDGSVEITSSWDLPADLKPAGVRMVIEFSHAQRYPRAWIYSLPATAVLVLELKTNAKPVVVPFRLGAGRSVAALTVDDSAAASTLLLCELPKGTIREASADQVLKSGELDVARCRIVADDLAKQGLRECTDLISYQQKRYVEHDLLAADGSDDEILRKGRMIVIADREGARLWRTSGEKATAYVGTGRAWPGSVVLRNLAGIPTDWLIAPPARLFVSPAGRLGFVSETRTSIWIVTPRWTPKRSKQRTKNS